MENLEKKLSHCSNVTDADIQEIKSFCEMGSVGMLNTAIRCLKIVRGRLINEERLTYEDKPIDVERFDAIVRDSFSVYVVNGVFNHRYATVPSYFSLMNTEEGFDLIYTGQESNSLFTKIANISEEYALVYLNVNQVVYIKNHKTGDLVPMISEHNNHYVYDIEKGKIKEVMKDVN